MTETLGSLSSNLRPAGSQAVSFRSFSFYRSTALSLSLFNNRPTRSTTLHPTLKGPTVLPSVDAHKERSQPAICSPSVSPLQLLIHLSNSSSTINQ